MNKNVNFQPLIIIGAARSGTKILRNTIAIHNQINAIPYDINFIWRYGNENIPHDELKLKDFSLKNRNFINKFFGKYLNTAPFIVEKTVSNCLRVEYINQVFPNAKYIHLVRNPFDVIESAYRQWTEKPNFSYLIKKSLDFPLFHCFSYATKYVFNETLRVLSNNNKNSTWGPKYDGIYDDLSKRNLWEVCALQWQKCFVLAKDGLSKIPAKDRIFVKYEDFVLSPQDTMNNFSQFLHIENSYNDDLFLEKISKKNIGKGSTIPEEYQQEIAKIIEPQLLELGYPIRPNNK